MPTDQVYQAGMAVGLQTAQGTVNATTQALTGALDLTDGIVYGHRAAGVRGTGITPPTFEPVREPRQQVAASFTEQAAAFQTEEANGLVFTWLVQGNGITDDATVGQARPGNGLATTDDVGLDALYQIAGLAGADASQTYEYTPAHNASTSGATPYATIKVWQGTFSYVLIDCAISSLRFTQDPGGFIIAEAAISVGIWDQANEFADTVTFPTFDYGNYAALFPARIVSVNHTWGTARSFETLSLSILNDLQFVQRSNLATGRTIVQETRRVEMEATMLVDATTPGTTDIIEQADLIRTVAPTTDITWTVGSAAAAQYESMAFEYNNVQVDTVQPDASGQTSMVQKVKNLATGITAGSEFKLIFQ